VCEECDKNKGYKLSSDRKNCEKTCPSGSIQVKLGNSNYCVTTNNISDSSCVSANGRNVCTYSAASSICASYNNGGLSWRLPNSDEVAYFGGYMSELNLCDRKGGCADDYSSSGSFECTRNADGSTTCEGKVVYADKFPSCVWNLLYSTSIITGELTPLKQAYGRENGVWKERRLLGAEEPKASVRCLVPIN